MQDLKDRTAVVTGAASGIGLALAEQFVASGMHVAIADVEPAPLEDARAKLEARGADVLAVVTDVSDADSMDAFAEKTLERFGAVHVVCNNAGVGSGGAAWELSTEDWQFVLGPNLWGVIHGIRVFVPHLVAQGEGHVVNTASMAGLVTVPGMAPYNVSKHGVVALSETLLGDLRGVGSPVGVSLLCPGFVRTRIFESQRHRPDAWVGAETDPEVAKLQEEMLEQVLATAATPESIAEQVLDAVRNDRFYILTHEGTGAAVESRMRTIVEGRNPDPIAPLVFAQDPSSPD